MPYVLINDHNIIESVSDKPVVNIGAGQRVIATKHNKPEELIGKRISKKEVNKLAIICNWNATCGISTYTKYLADELKKKIQEIRIFSEEDSNPTAPDDDTVVRCWKRGESMRQAIKAIKEWKPDFVIIQHEFGIFPRATFFLQMLTELTDIPYAVVLHSVYATHLDKTVSTSAISNIIVHSNQAKEVLIKLGHDEKVISVIPHGCVHHDNVKQLWNSFQTPYAIVQFGFGFFYKGVDRAIEAVSILKKSYPKYNKIFYCYLCSQTAHSSNAHAEYYKFLIKKIEELDVADNVAIIQKFQSEQVITNYLRTAKLALFPYLTDPNNTVYGATGACRVAMANKIPVIASESHLFDDFEGIVPRPSDAASLAKEIDKIFSDWKYKDALINKSQDYLKQNNWSVSADRYIGVMRKILGSDLYVEI